MLGEDRPGLCGHHHSLATIDVSTQEVMGCSPEAKDSHRCQQTDHSQKFLKSRVKSTFWIFLANIYHKTQCGSQSAGRRFCIQYLSSRPAGRRLPFASLSAAPWRSTCRHPRSRRRCCVPCGASPGRSWTISCLSCLCRWSCRGTGATIL